MVENSGGEDVTGNRGRKIRGSKATEGLESQYKFYYIL